jgi:DNA-binding transcriptional ArsR family regulator
MTHEDKRATVCQAKRTVARVQNYWGRGIGLPLVCAYFEGTWLTTREIAEEADLSEDTAARRLSELVAIGRVERRRSGRSHLYRAGGAAAQRTYEMINELLLTAKRG